MMPTLMVEPCRQGQAEGFPLPGIPFEQVLFDSVEKARFFQGPFRGHQLVSAWVAVHALDDDFRAQQGNSPHKPGQGLLPGEKFERP